MRPPCSFQHVASLGTREVEGATGRGTYQSGQEWCTQLALLPKGTQPCGHAQLQRRLGLPECLEGRRNEAVNSCAVFATVCPFIHKIFQSPSHTCNIVPPLQGPHARPHRAVTSRPSVRRPPSAVCRLSSGPRRVSCQLVISALTRQAPASLPSTRPLSGRAGWSQVGISI